MKTTKRNIALIASSVMIVVIAVAIFEWMSEDGFENFIIGSQTLVTENKQQITNKLPASAQLVDDTAGWKIYRNDKYGFELRYPSNYEISKTTAFAIQSEFEMISFDNMTGAGLVVPYKGKELNMNGITAVELPLGGNMDNGMEFEIGFNDFPEKNKYFRILFETKKPGLDYKLSEFRQILSTFKLTR